MSPLNYFAGSRHGCALRAWERAIGERYPSSAWARVIPKQQNTHVRLGPGTSHRITARVGTRPKPPQSSLPSK